MAKKVSVAKNEVVYSVHPGVAYVQAIVDNLPKTTGKSLDEWLKFVKARGPADEKELGIWLKTEHSLGATSAGLIAQRARGKRQGFDGAAGYLRAAAGYVAAMYNDGKVALRRTHHALIQLGCSMGKDVKVCPCTSIVPLYRNHVFAQVKPTTRTRIDFGLALKGVKKKPPKRLIGTGGEKKGDRITHRFPITSLEEIDAEVREWLEGAPD